MSGFTGIVCYNNFPSYKLDTIAFPEKINGSYLKLQEVRSNTYCFVYYGNNRFNKLPVIKSSKEEISGTEGVQLKSGTFTTKEQNTSLKGTNLQLESLLLNLSQEHGTFSGFNFNKDGTELILYTDHTSSRQIFYYSDKNIFVFSSSIFLLRDLLRNLEINFKLCEPACYMLLSLGYLLKNYTLVKEIKKLEAGQYITKTENEIVIKEYHNFFRPTLFTKINNDLLEEIDRLFNHSVKLEYQFDKDHFLNHIVTLSGGLDSRMNLMLAKKNGFQEMTALTFSEGMQPDELIARKISHDLKLQHIIILLNNGLHLFDIETPLILNNCSVYYFGAAHTLSAVNKINLQNYGLLHNGSLAESSKGGYLSQKYHTKPLLSNRYAVSDKMFNRFQPLFENEISSSYPNDEMFVHYSRGFNAINNGIWMTQPFTESVMTFMEPNFANLAFSISPELRYNAFLTIDWLKFRHKDMTFYNWSNIGTLPTNNKYKILSQKIINKASRMISSRSNSSVPLSYWYETNVNFRKFIDETYKTSPSWELISNEMKNDIGILYNSNTISEKLLCISLLKSLELLFWL